MNKRTIVALALTPLVALGCTKADTDAMLTGLGNAGLTPAEAECYSGVLAEHLKAKYYNEVAANLLEGEGLSQALNRGRRKYGEEFSEQHSNARNDLAACLR
ncbi:hypothetical protein Thimo_0640 [Thioflavicoccus mobilis 8321]|uniref:Lipoprotein n=1 Tax=Thioflavicoccus mobilis 8321 TaxID=765912 RepID=L0GVV6_9GAMM|nr:hypothetical protein [Thioflavicoccus mobilis]AGA89480.1 hypothetical protein Thimo_0640 [Thioflavicoccus mobilis 8321]